MTTRGEHTTGSEFVSAAPPLGYIPSFDGLRGLGVALVVIGHGLGGKLDGFAALVDMFFILSGFLITTLLLEEHRSKGRIDMKDFFFRRAIRLFPVMYFTLLVTLIGGLAFGDAEFRRQTVEDVWSAAVYMYHVVHPTYDVLLTGGEPQPRPLSPLWTLSVEEHFYLFGAFLTAASIKFRQARTVVVVFMAFWVFVAVARATDHVGFRMMWYSRPDALAIGVALAYVNALLPAQLSARATTLLRRAGVTAAVLQLAVMLQGTWIVKPLGLYPPSFPEAGQTLNDSVLWGEYGYSLADLCSTIMILALVRCGDFGLQRGFSWKPAQLLGRRSYTIYVIHIPMALILHQIAQKTTQFGGLVELMYIPGLVIGTEIVHRCIELPSAKFFRDRQKAKRAARAAAL